MSSDEMPQGDGGEQIIARSLSANAREFQLPASTPVGSAVSKTVDLFLIYLGQAKSEIPPQGKTLWLYRPFELTNQPPLILQKAKVKPVKASRDPFETLDYG